MGFKAPGQRRDLPPSSGRCTTLWDWDHRPIKMATPPASTLAHRHPPTLSSLYLSATASPTLWAFSCSRQQGESSVVHHRAQRAGRAAGHMLADGRIGGQRKCSREPAGAAARSTTPYCSYRVRKLASRPASQPASRPASHRSSCPRPPEFCRPATIHPPTHPPFLPVSQPRQPPIQPPTGTLPPAPTHPPTEMVLPRSLAASFTVSTALPTLPLAPS